MVGVIKAFRIVRENQIKTANWASKNLGKVFAFVILMVSIPYILFHIASQFYDFSLIAQIIIGIFVGLLWGISLTYLLSLHIIKELDLKVE